MADKPILFSAPMVRALLDGTKTQTRRILKPQPEPVEGYSEPWVRIHGQMGLEDYLMRDVTPRFWAKYKVGDRLWVRETHAIFIGGRNLGEDDMVFYRADGHKDSEVGAWKPSIFMPRWASRLTLAVTDVRVQRLQDISNEDAQAEGVVFSEQWNGYVVPGVEHPNKDFPVFSRGTPREMYAALWDHINGSGEWLKNPWIVALTFAIERRNIDA